MMQHNKEDNKPGVREEAERVLTPPASTAQGDKDA